MTNSDKTMISRHSCVGMNSAKMCIRCSASTTQGRMRRGLWHCLACAAKIDAKAADRRAA